MRTFLANFLMASVGGPPSDSRSKESMSRIRSRKACSASGHMAVQLPSRVPLPMPSAA